MSKKREYEGQTESPETEYLLFHDLGAMGKTDKQDEEYNTKFVKFMKGINQPIGNITIQDG